MNGAKVLGLDIVDVEPARARSHLPRRPIDTEFIQTPIQQAGLADNSFDKIFSFCVIEHIPEHKEVLDHCYRILKPGGMISFSVDSLANVPPDLLRRHAADYHVAKYFQVDELKRELEEVGFRDAIVYPIFRGQYALNLFVDGINRSFRYGRLEAILKYFRLSRSDKLCDSKEEGMYLVAKAWKQHSIA
jgi:SAM-dependent methyltransferase